MTPKQLLNAALKGLSLEQQLNLIEEKRAELAEQLKIHESKMTNGTQGERVACAKLGLRWNKDTVHGADAWDKDGQGVELKCFKSSAKRANITYKVPKRKAGESIEQHAVRVHDYFLQRALGGHYWVMLSHGSTQFVRSWHVPANTFARAMYHWSLNNPEKTELNLGALYCNKCRIPHRVDTIAHLLNQKSLSYAFPDRVPGQCKK